MTNNKLELPDSQCTANGDGEAVGSNRGGAPPLNRNRMTWGGRGWAAIGSYPKGAAWVRRQVVRLRAELEAAVLEAKTEIGVLESALIQSACRHEGRALLAGRWLRVAGDDLSVADRLALANTACAASDSRDRCIARLGLAAAPERTAWDEVEAELEQEISEIFRGDE